MRAIPHVDLEDYGITEGTLRTMYEEWKAGAAKSDLERRFLGKGESHGKLFSSLVRRYLHIETEGTHPLVRENQRLTLEIEKLREENARLQEQLKFNL